MLWNLDDLKSFTLRATDGEIGKVEEAWFSDDSWVVRYLVVKTGGLLDRERVLISPLALDVPNGPARALPVALTQEEVRNAPNADTRTTVSRENEIAYHDYYGWPYYWVGGPMWGSFPTPGELSRAQLSRASARSPEASEAKSEESRSIRLRSTDEVRGYWFEGRDGGLGHIDDFVIEDEGWSIRYLVVNTSNWWPGGKKILLPRSLVREVSWDAQTVSTDVSRETLKSAPEYEEDIPIPPAFEALLAQHYGLAGTATGQR